MTIDTAPSASGSRELLRRLSERGPRQDLIVYGAFVLLLATFAVLLRDSGFLSVGNLQTIASAAAPIIVMAVGLTFALAAAEIDLSISAVVGLASLVAANVLRDYGFGPGLLAAIGVGLCVGAVNGWLVVRYRIPSFLVTLGTVGIAAGVARSLNDLKSVPIQDEFFRSTFGSGSIGPLTANITWALVVVIAGHVALRKLRLGRHVLAIGADPIAARSVGIRADRVRMVVLCISSVCAAFAGVLLASRLSVGRHNLGEDDLLTVIAAVVIGGTALFGGRASVIGSAVGALIMAMLNNGFILLGLDVSQQMIGRGLLIIVAVALSVAPIRDRS